MTERILVICEKPTAARRIAEALDADRAPESYRKRGVPYFIARRGRKDLVVVSALGHLFTIAQDEGKWIYPVFGFKWVPAYEADKRYSKTRNFIEVIRKLSVGVMGYVSACDYDMEGSLIAYMILLHICGEESLGKARRMMYSTLMEGDLINAWEDMPETLDFPMIEAGRTRHEVDWLFGINLTRALTLSVKNATGYYKTLSIGRVQGPTLNFIRQREVKIRTFVPTPFWVIEAETRLGRKKYPLEYDKPRVDNMGEAEEVEKTCKGKDGVITFITSERREQWPFPPFSLGDLQREAYYKFKYSPRTTLQAAERLYLDALISYPRTSSQRLPPSIDPRRILGGLRRIKEYSEIADVLLSKSVLRPRQGSKDDPAHPAIYPTGRLPGRFSRVEGKIFDLICRRFLAALGNPAVREIFVAHVDVNGYMFLLKGNQLVEKGWTVFYAPYFREKRVVLPNLKIGQKIPMIRMEAKRRRTKSPARFNSTSLLKFMEDEGIGTKATRAEIIDTLHKRGYVGGRSIEMTDLGLTIVETLEHLVPSILSAEMTRGLERDLEQIKTGDLASNSVVEGAVEILKPILSEFKANEELIGAEINNALKSQASKERTLGSCPSCGVGEIRLIRNKRTGKRFAGCSNFFNGTCDVSFPLPQRGKILITGEKCPHCGAPIIKVLQRRRRPWKLCVDFDCPGKKREGEDGG